MSKPKVIVFYLPQYHPTPDNDRWWGKGFTEWTNVAKARPLFRGHYQPHVPADLGFYDLRLPEVREAQAELAREAGIYGFCYYHYWFSNGKVELELPFNEVCALGKPDFPFMLCWANESWHRKFWDKDDKGTSKEMLVEQTYPGDEDHIAHFYRLLPAFKDPRYIRIDGKPAFMIYKPDAFPDITGFIRLWNALAEKEGLGGICFIAQLQERFFEERYDDLIGKGFDIINTVGLYEGLMSQYNILEKFVYPLAHHVLNRPLSREYKKVYPHFVTSLDNKEKVCPTIIPNWDHTPRSGNNGWVLTDPAPEHVKKHFMQMLRIAKEKKETEPVVFLKSWNEWGEGNYMEPDLKYGHSYINALTEVLKEIE